MQKVITFILAIVAIITLSLPASAKDFTVGDLTINNPWARASAGRAKNGAAYVTQITNNGHQTDRLIAVTTPVAKKASLHISKMEGGIMKMRPIKAMEIAPGKPATMHPGGIHIMMMHLENPLKKGETFPITLTFEKAGNITLEFKVMKVGARKMQSMNPCTKK